MLIASCRVMARQRPRAVARDLGGATETGWEVTGRLFSVRALLRLADERGRNCAEVDAIAREHLTQVARKIDDLSALRNELRQLIGSCSQGTVADCRIIESLSQPPIADFAGLSG